MNNDDNLIVFGFDNKFVRFVTVPTTIFFDKRVSYNALGIYCQLVSLQESFPPSPGYTDLTIFKNTDIELINDGLNELLELGYIREVSGNEINSISTMYKIFMQPSKKA